jgi:hypothetical protein
VQAVGAALELLAPGANESPFRIENENRVMTFAGGMYRVVNVDMSLRILANAMGASEAYMRWDRSPIVNGFVRVVVRAENRNLLSDFIGYSRRVRLISLALPRYLLLLATGFASSFRATDVLSLPVAGRQIAARIPSSPHR